MALVARKRLAVVQDRTNAFARVQAREAGFLETARSEMRMGKFHLLTHNGKTGVSLDFPVGHTCTPTEICGKVCYAAQPEAPMQWNKSLVKRLRNWLYILATPPDLIVSRIRNELRSMAAVLAKKDVEQDFIRICGSGDLFPEVLPVLDLFCRWFPHIKVWVVTRKFDLAAQLAPHPNLFLQLSIDASTPLVERRKAKELIATHPRTYLSFLRTSPTDDTHGAAIVFAEKKTHGLPYSKEDCPVDSGRLELLLEKGKSGSACARCNKCFTEKTLVRQRLADV